MEDWSCPICKGPFKSIQHIFPGLTLARIVWRSTRWPLDSSIFSSQPISSWIKAMIEFKISATTIMDQIWLARNLLIQKAIKLEIPHFLK